MKEKRNVYLEENLRQRKERPVPLTLREERLRKVFRVRLDRWTVRVER